MSSKYNIMYHFVFCTKYRRKVFTSGYDTLIVNIISSIDFNFEIIEAGVDRDHIHLAISSPPKYSPSQIARVFKQLTTRAAWKHYGDHLSKFFWSRKILWSAGYYVATVGNVSKTSVLEYIESQGK